MDLTEWKQSPPRQVPLGVRQVLETTFDARISTGSAPDDFVVTPGGVVGTVRVGDETVTVRPKIDIDRVLFMVAYANDPYGWEVELSNLGHVDSLVDGMAALFVRLCEPLVAGGLLRDYRRVDVDARVIRGKVRWDAQARRPLPLPIAVRHDVHDDDIVENRILREACQVLRRAEVSGRRAPALGRLWNALEHVSPLRTATDEVDRIHWGRRNQHYQAAVKLAGVILQGQMLDVRPGQVPVSGFTIKMHEIFEDFLRAALRTAWSAPVEDMPDSWKGRGLSLATNASVPLNPDLGWRDHSEWRYVGDAKYKKDSGSGASSDVYQALAYAVATGLRRCTLFYADGGQDQDLFIPAADKTICVRHLDLSAAPDAVLERIGREASAALASGLVGARR